MPVSSRPLLLLPLALTALVGSASAQADRSALLAADRAASNAVFRQDLPAGLEPSLDSSVVLLYPGAPIIQGRDRAIALLRAQAGLGRLSLSWVPLVAAVAGDGQMGITSGLLLVRRRDAADSVPAEGHYIMGWRRAGDAWKITALVLNGIGGEDSSAPISPVPAGELAISPAARPAAEADRAFARLAADSGAPLAFERYAAPDVTTLPGPNGLAIGPDALRQRLASGPLAEAAWRWHPVWGTASRDGDLALTIGVAEISLGAETWYSKYFTVWRKQPDGSLRFILDTGNDRPR